MKKILVSDSIDKEGIELLNKEKDFRVDIKTELGPEELVKVIGEYDGLIVRSQTKVNSAVIAAASGLKVIARAGTGIDNVDVETATRKGIVVMNVPGGNTVSAAENTIALLLSLARNIPQANASMKSGKWEKKKFIGIEVHGKTLGILGLGRIGTEVARMAQGMGMLTMGSDPFVSAEQAKKSGIEYVPFEDVLKKADFITVHTPLNKDTKYMLGEKEFAKMKEGARVINCARGGIIDENALCAAVKSGRIAGAALDVFEKEPPENSPLLALDRVITTPHLGASTDEAQARVSADCAGQVIDFLKNGVIRNALNVPSIEPELLRQIEPYLKLAGKLGKFQGQFVQGPVDVINVLYSGDVSSYNSNPMTLAVVKSLLEVMLGNTLNFVNALPIARERGIKVIEGKTGTPEDYTNLITVEVGSAGSKKSVAGTVLSKEMQRIVRIDDYDVDVVPSEYILICTHDDRPGMVGKIGTVLGGEKINIAGLQLSRKKKGDANLTVLNVDISPSEKVVGKLKKIEGIRDVRFVELK